jgi:hypothetical protein
LKGQTKTDTYLKKLLLNLLFLFPIISEAQTSVYHPFPEDSAKWCTQECYVPSIGPGHYQENTYELNGKKLINGIWYSKMYCAGTYCSSNNCSCPPATVGGVCYRIRQDIAQKKVWLHVDSTNTDTIFLDFDLHVGDTLDARREFWAGLGPCHCLTVNSIDSVLIGTQYRTRYKYLYGTFPNYMIDGIGPDHGFFYGPNGYPDGMAQLENFLQNSHFYYPSYSSATVNMNQYCFNFTTGIEEQNPISFFISPNPAHDILNVECKLPNAELKIYDMMGREVMQKEISPSADGSKLEIGIGFAAGVYFVRVSDGKQTAVQKLIVE